jgi:hypothetical protein
VVLGFGAHFEQKRTAQLLQLGILIEVAHNVHHH